jgi:hypothetical protein
LEDFCVAHELDNGSLISPLSNLNRIGPKVGLSAASGSLFAAATHDLTFAKRLGLFNSSDGRRNFRSNDFTPRVIFWRNPLALAVSFMT